MVALVERAAEQVDHAKAEKMAAKLSKGQFDLDDLADQLKQLQKMGGMSGIMGMLPGVQKAKKQIAESGLGDKTFARQGAIISSMTKAERKKPDLLNASRKRRVAAGAGVDVADINRLLKQHRQMADMLKSMSKDGGNGMARMAQAMGMGGGGGMPPGMGGMGGGGPGGIDLARLKSLGGGALGGPGAPQLPGLGGGSPFDLKKK